MEKVYKDVFENTISEQQALSKGEYSISYIIDGKVKRVELFFNGEIKSMIYYRGINETHQEILDLEILNNHHIAIREIETFGKYKLEKDFIYDDLAILKANRNYLYDINSLQVGYEWIENGATVYDKTRKFFYDLDQNPDTYLFECTYNEDGSVFEIEFNNLHLDPSGHESKIFDHSPEDIAELMSISGISQELMDYYLSSDVTPNF